MKKIKQVGDLLFWMTLISPIFSFALSSIIGEAYIFGVAGIIRYSWIMLFFIFFWYFIDFSWRKTKKI